MLLPWYERPIRQRSQFTMNGNSVVKTSHYCLFSQEFCHGSRKWKITQVEVLVQRHCDKNGHFIGDLPPGLVFVSPAAASIPWCFDPSARWSSQIAPNCPEFSFTLVFPLQRPSLLNISSRVFAGHVSNSVILTEVWSPALLLLHQLHIYILKICESWKVWVMQRSVLYNAQEKKV